MSTEPAIDELRATEKRMRGRFATDAVVADLMTEYPALCGRFAADLASERDRLLCQTGALMLVKFVAQARNSPRLG